MNSKKITITLLCAFISNNTLALDPFETKEGLKAALLVYPFFIIPGMLLNLFKSAPQPGVTLREALQNMFTPSSIGTYTPTLYYEFSRELENIIKALEDPSKIDTYNLTEYKKVAEINSIEDVKRIPHLWELTRQVILSGYRSKALEALQYFHQIVNALLERTRLQKLSWWQRLYFKFKGQSPATWQLLALQFKGKNPTIKEQIDFLNRFLENRLFMLNEFLHLPIKEKFLTSFAEEKFNDFYTKFLQKHS